MKNNIRLVTQDNSKREQFAEAIIALVKAYHPEWKIDQVRSSDLATRGMTFFFGPGQRLGISHGGDRSYAHWPPFIDLDKDPAAGFAAVVEAIKSRPLPSWKLSSDYTAVKEGDFLVVGCQKIAGSLVKEIAGAFK